VQHFNHKHQATEREDSLFNILTVEISIYLYVYVLFQQVFSLSTDNHFYLQTKTETALRNKVCSTTGKSLCFELTKHPVKETELLKQSKIDLQQKNTVMMNSETHRQVRNKHSEVTAEVSASNDTSQAVRIINEAFELC